MVQARQTEEETDWLLSLAEESSALCGIVGWAPLTSPHLPIALERWKHKPLLRGFRHIVQAEPDGFLDQAAFHDGIDRLTNDGYTYDLLIYAKQLPEAIRCVDQHPNQIFVLDHIAKPAIGSDMAWWQKQMQDLAQRENVFCKLSGMVTETGPTPWTPCLLEPYFQTALHAFTPARLMIGTDWPVLTVACSYGAWWQTVEAWTAPLTAAEQDQILGRSAQRAYRLPRPLPSGPTL